MNHTVFFSRKAWRDERGLTLVELMVVLGIIGITIAITTLPQLEMHKTILVGQNKSARALQISDLKQKLTSTEDALTKSALASSDNKDLCACTQGGAAVVAGTKTPLCAQSICIANTETDFSFYASVGPNLVKLTGTQAEPAYYDDVGRPCAVAKSETNSEEPCAYKIITSFKAKCASGLGTCDHADHLTVNLEIMPTVGRSDKGYEKTKIIYTPTVNYPPMITQVAAATLVFNETKQIPIYADAGHADEKQNFYFEQCKSGDPSLSEVKCYRFINSIGQVILTAKSKTGTAKVTLRINDGANVNASSPAMEFDVTVKAP